MDKTLMNIEDIARHYITAPAYEASSSVVKSFRQFIIDLAQVELQGIEFEFVDFEPYFRGPALSLEDVHTDYNQGKLTITRLFNNSDLLGPEINLLFRCIHEIHHIKLNVDFGWQGECATALHFMSFTDNPLFQQILFSESIGQVSVRLARGAFPDPQKVVLYEPEVWRQIALEMQ